MNVVALVENLQRLRLRGAGFTSTYLEGEYGRQHVYSLVGTGPLPPIVLFHGIGASASSFAPLMRRLSYACQRVCALDLPGHGLSAPLPDRPGHRALFDAGCNVARSLFDGPAIVFGNSMGGAFALEFTRRHPELVLGLVLCSPAGSPMDAVLLQSFLARFDLARAGAAREFIRRVFPEPAWYSVLMEPLVRRIFSSPTVRGILEDVKPNEGVERADLHALVMPLLFIWGQRDRLMPPEHLAFYRENLPPHARIVEPESFGHCPQVDEPSAVSRLIVEFAKDVQQNGRGVDRIISGRNS